MLGYTGAAATGAATTGTVIAGDAITAAADSPEVAGVDPADGSGGFCRGPSHRILEDFE